MNALPSSAAFDVDAMADLLEFVIFNSELFAPRIEVVATGDMSVDTALEVLG